MLKKYIGDVLILIGVIIASYNFTKLYLFSVLGNAQYSIDNLYIFITLGISLTTLGILVTRKWK